MKPEQFLESVLIEFRSLKKVAEKAVQQVSDKDFFSAPDSESNSIAVLMKHLAGNSTMNNWRSLGMQFLN